MCLIIDVNVAINILLKSDDPDYADVHKAIFTSKTNPAKIVYGGKLAKEYLQNKEVMRVLLLLDRAGRTRKISDIIVEAECVVVNNLGLCRSNDQHIVALARVGNTRLLCSRDAALHDDFTNRLLIENPRGKVYQYSSHKHLIRQFCQP